MRCQPAGIKAQPDAGRRGVAWPVAWMGWGAGSAWVVGSARRTDADAGARAPPPLAGFVPGLHSPRAWSCTVPPSCRPAAGRVWRVVGELWDKWRVLCVCPRVRRRSPSIGEGCNPSRPPFDAAAPDAGTPRRAARFRDPRLGVRSARAGGARVLRGGGPSGSKGGSGGLPPLAPALPAHAPSGRTTVVCGA